MPVRIAQARARQAWPSARASLLGDPLALSAHERRATVEARRDLEPHPRPPAHMDRQEARVELARRVLEQPDVDGDACRAQTRRAARLARIRIAHRGHDARHSRGEHGIDAWRSAPMRVARLERDVHRGAARIGAAPRSIGQRVDLGVRFACALVESLADDRAVAHDHAADARVGRRRVKAARRKLEGARHVGAVSLRVARHFARGRFAAGGASTSRSASRKSETSWKDR